MNTITIYGLVESEEHGKELYAIEHPENETIPAGWSTNINDIKSQLPPEPVDPNQVLQAKMMAQIAALNKQVADLTGGAR